LSRSIHFSLPLLVVTLALGAVAAAGCSTETSASGFNGTTPALSDPSGSSGFTQGPTDDAAAPKNSLYRGNPLCHVTGPDTCMPDDDGTTRTSNTQTCALPPPDAGDAGSAASFQSPGCRISRGDGGIGPACLPITSPPGGDGATCESGEQCAPGFDCVAGVGQPTGDKTCRHYCCSGSCKGHGSQGGGMTFCDIQNLVDVNDKAPVCMPLKRCKLFGVGECAVTETCAVVTESGDTGCIGIGDQQAGLSCDDTHCAAKLTCLGQPGSRKCYKLCKVGGSDCGASEVCATSTSFKDPTFGICQKP
jgi:hypothetical protein